jgi:hypothetical protein
MSDTADEPAVDGAVDGSDADVERPVTEESKLGAIGAKILATIPKPMLGIRGTLFKRLAIKSLENYHKTAGGDAMAINAKAGQQIEFEPIKYRAPEEVDEGEQPGWTVKGRDKTWNPGAEGNSVNYLGRTPTVLLEDDDHVEAGWLAPRIGSAIELDNYWPIFTNAEFNVVPEFGGAGGANGHARADGGMEFDIELAHPGEWAGDNLVDLDSGPGYDGMRVSTQKAREWRTEESDSEEMQRQEDRGYIRGLANGQEGPSIMKLLLVCAGIILGVLAIVFIGPELVGGSGGGGGGINPLTMLPAVLGGL